MVLARGAAVGSLPSAVLARRTASDRFRPWGRRLLPHLPVAVFIGAYVLRFGLLSVQVQDGYGTPGYDMGIFDQGVWLLSRFHAPYVTVMGRDLFGDHTSFILLLAVPLYWVWPEAQTLLVLQAALLAAAAIPIYLLAIKRTRSVVIASALAAAYLLNPALQQGNLEQFHPECFLAFAVALAVYAAVESKGRLLALSVVACLLVKEDTALLMIPLGVWVAWRRNPKWGLTIVAASAAYMAFATQVVIRLLLGTTSFYSDRIPFGGLKGLIEEPFLHLATFWNYLWSGYKPFYLWQMGSSFGWVFLLSPEVALIGLLTLSENVLSNFPYMQQIIRHYSLPLVPVLAMGTVYAVASLRTARRRYMATSVALVGALLSAGLWGLTPWLSRDSVYLHLAPNSPITISINRVLAEIPPNAVVAASYPLVPHLDHRIQIYQWPTPFSATYWYLYKQEGQTLPFAGEVQYLALAEPLSPSEQGVFDSIARQFRLIDDGGGVAVYRRIAPAR
jgi:uncharacterized membrane protein